MKRYLGISLVGFCSLLLVAGVAMAKTGTFELLSEDIENDLGPDVDYVAPVSNKVLSDTTWIADWSFDQSCGSPGWVKLDYKKRIDNSVYWATATVTVSWDSVPRIDNKAAILRKHDLCFAQDGYGNDWDQSIVLNYSGTATLSFGLISDSEPGFDFVTVECDSLGLSQSLVNFAANPTANPAAFRDEIFVTDGDQSAGLAVSALGLVDYGPGTHKALIRFFSDGGYSDEDGDYATVLNAGAIVDSIVVTGGIAYTEEFEGALGANVSFQNTANNTPFGQFARIYSHITDNDKCTENTTCAWLQTDVFTPAYFADMAFGPGSAVIKNWLDDRFISPWAPLTGTLSATGTVLQFRRFPGNTFGQGRIVQQWTVRGKVRLDNTDTSTTGDSVDCVTFWGHSSQFNSLSTFIWVTSLFDMTPYFDVASTELQVSFRVADWQEIAGIGPPATLNTGPGPFTDRIKIGRRSLLGPVMNPGIDTRTQGQDCFPTAQNAITPGEHFSPTTDRFGTCAFSMGTELGINSPGSPNLITGDSVTIDVQDARPGGGGIATIKWYGQIIAGPHAGKAPAPYSVGANGFFETTADTMKSASGAVLANRYTRDLDDTYFRGGDQLVYFWAATDNGGGFSSFPTGMTALPADLAAAELATGGITKVNYLPTITWDPTYLAAIAADANGDIDPTPTQIANSSQKNCILYYQHTTANRRSGPTQTTSFMRTLNALGYNGSYDIYDVQGYGNTNNQLGGRSTIQQLTGYRLIVEDDGRSGLIPNIPDGSSTDTDKVNQALIYQNWLNAASSSAAGQATLWVIGENTVFERVTNALFTGHFGISTTVTNQGLSNNPDVEGIAAHAFVSGSPNFTGDRFSLNGGCPTIRAYDRYTVSTATATHRYVAGTATASAAIAMRSNSTDQWNTVAMGFAWFDIRDRFGGAPGTPAKTLAKKILDNVLGPCVEAVDPTDNGPVDTAVPRVSALHQNVPNPFNPSTKISFDLARNGQVKLQVFDVAGKLVRTLVSGSREAGRYNEIWNGLDNQGARVSSGVYFYQLVTDDLTATKKMVVLK